MSVPHRVTVIIPHYNGEAILRRCLLSLQRTQAIPIRILIVNNGSSDNSLEMVRTEFPHVRILQSRVNRGYAGGCNFGMRHASSPYVVLLNNDAEVNPAWLKEMMAVMEGDASIAAVQPKVLSIQNPDHFDYCGAAGGEMDRYGYPFARGRLFHEVEMDRGQYDPTCDVFWATGAAMLVRTSAIDRVGMLEEAFFAHMEEIDLCWRFHLAGYRVCSASRAVVFHQTGGTLDQESFRKMALNHRNSLLMLLRNYETGTLLRIFPVRLFLEGLTVCAAITRFQWKRAMAVFAGLFGMLAQAETIRSGRANVRRIRVLTDKALMRRLYPRSVALAFFLWKKHCYSDLQHIPEK